MRNTPESSKEEYMRLMESKKPAPIVNIKPMRKSPYSFDGKDIVAIVRTDNRREGVKEGIRLIGGLEPFVKDVSGDIIIKPNFNTDDPFPRNTHPETVGIIAESLIETGFPAERIVIGEMSGRYRGLPTRNTMSYMGIFEIIDALGIQFKCFDEEDWVTVIPPYAESWSEGVKIPKCILEADRVIFTPIMRPHEDAEFSLVMKLAVGMMDVSARDILHNGYKFYPKLAEFNLTFSMDLAIIDGLKCYIDEGPEFKEMVEPNIIIVGNNRVATDAVALSLMKYLRTFGIKNKPVLEHKQFIYAKKLGLESRLNNIDLRTYDTLQSQDFDDIISLIKEELSIK
jgi:uncharacterized protein (DUF362 family)